MASLLARGLITPEQFEAGIEIVAGHEAFTTVTGTRSSSVDLHRVVTSHQPGSGTSDAMDRWWTIYIGFAALVYTRCRVQAWDIVAYVRGSDPWPEDTLPQLIRALDFWHDHRDDWDPRLISGPGSGLNPRPARRVRTPGQRSSSTSCDPSYLSAQCCADTSCARRSGTNTLRRNDFKQRAGHAAAATVPLRTVAQEPRRASG